MREERTRVVSFSGIDGAGKSSQIQALECHLRKLSIRVRVLRFWDDVVVLSGLREFVSCKAFKGDQGAGSPDKPIQRRDKNVAAWYTTAVRLFLYLLDAISLRVVMARTAADDGAFILFDRYIYDELANLPLNFRLIRAYARLILKLSPTPEVALIVDADPETALERKPEYPLEFLRRNREAYLVLSRLTREINVVTPSSIEETASRITELISKNCLPTLPESRIPNLRTLQRHSLEAKTRDG